jgi:transcription-repair coupling factor (superfamily II helicase)
MSFRPLIRQVQTLPFIQEALAKLTPGESLHLQGANRMARGLVATVLAQTRQSSLCIVCGTLEEAARWSAQLELMGWSVVHFYPTSEASPYEPFDPEEETTWGQLQVLAELTCASANNSFALVTTERALQPHLPPKDLFRHYIQEVKAGDALPLESFIQTLVRLGYARANTVETEGQFARRGDIVDIFPVSAEMPLRMEWFGDDVERIREFDPNTQRSLDLVPQLRLTPTNFGSMVLPLLQDRLTDAQVQHLPTAMQEDYQNKILEDQMPEGARRWFGFAFEQVHSLLDYLSEDTLVVLDEPALCYAHARRWLEHSQEQFIEVFGQAPDRYQSLHRACFDQQSLDLLPDLSASIFCGLALSEIATDARTHGNLAARPVPSVPHQFGSLAVMLKDLRAEGMAVWLISSQPSRTVALLQEHDCPAQFLTNPEDYRAAERLQRDRVAVALKSSGLAELEGFILPTLRTVVITDREFFGQHVLTTPSYVRKRRRAQSKQIDLNKLQPGDFVVHRSHGIGQFKKLETMALNRTSREYLVIEYSDGLLRVAVDQMGTLSRYRIMGEGKPALSKMSGATWEKQKQRVKKAVQKIAFDLLKLYAQRAEQRGVVFPPDSPWQDELESSFPYQVTPDQLKAIQAVKQDMELERPMDRLVCGDVGFGKTEVAVRAVFKALMGGKQCAVLVPTTVLAQQHYHTFKERFAPYPIRIGLLNRFRSAAERKILLAQLHTGDLDLVIATHQLLGKEVQFKDLGLLVIDEEQRFGVAQKEKIKLFKTKVDVLTLSATPIPRTLYMALSGVREMSLITTPPPSRRPIKTHLSPMDPEIVRTAIAQELDRGGQIFYVFNRVEGIEEVAAKLREMSPSARIVIAHGQMDEGQLEATMLAFSQGEADILVCTTIIESGLDIPRVNTIIVENANQLGLSQLYQLRGRVGRSGIQAHAWLFYKRDEALTDLARKRLRAIQEFTQLGSGYQLAMRDMEIRGVGNLLGSEQSGQLNTVGFDLYMELLEEAIQEIRGQEIPKVEDTQIDLSLTAFIPADYIPDLDRKLAAYRHLSTCANRAELGETLADWTDSFGPVPPPARQLVQVMEVKLMAKNLGFSRIKPEGASVVLETAMEAPAWDKLQTKLTASQREKCVYVPGRVVVRALNAMPGSQQLAFLSEVLARCSAELVSV